MKNAFDFNHLIQTRNKRTGELEFSLTLHKGHSVTSIDLNTDQFLKLVDGLQLTAEKSLTHEDNKVYIIQ